MIKNISIKVVGLLVMSNVVYTQSFGRMYTKEQVTKPGESQVLTSFKEEFAIENEVNPSTYIIGPGDELGLNILTSENIIWPLTVTPTGDILIPSVGIIHVAGIALDQVIEEVQSFVREKAYPSAKVNLALVNMRSFLIQVSGAVNKPGFVKITPLNRLDNVIATAGGFHQFAREFDIEIKRKSGVVEKVNFLNFLRYGDLTQNPTFLEGDVIKVPFGNIEKEGIVIRGSVSGRGYDIIEHEESLESFLQRRAKFNERADLERVTITRLVDGKEQFITVEPREFKTTILKAGDTVDILRERGVMVNGFVQAPGGYEFLPGYTAADYINLSGGNTLEGNPDNVIIYHLDGTSEKGQGVMIRRGDVIVVPRTYKSVFFGDSSILQIVAAVSTIFLTYLATQ